MKFHLVVTIDFLSLLQLDKPHHRKVYIPQLWLLQSTVAVASCGVCPNHARCSHQKFALASIQYYLSELPDVYRRLHQDARYDIFFAKSGFLHETTHVLSAFGRAIPHVVDRPHFQSPYSLDSSMFSGKRGGVVALRRAAKNMIALRDIGGWGGIFLHTLPPCALTATCADNITPSALVIYRGTAISFCYTHMDCSSTPSV